MTPEQIAGMVRDYLRPPDAELPGWVDSLFRYRVTETELYDACRQYKEDLKRGQWPLIGELKSYIARQRNQAPAQGVPAQKMDVRLAKGLGRMTGALMAYYGRAKLTYRGHEMVPRLSAQDFWPYDDAPPDVAVQTWREFFMAGEETRQRALDHVDT